VQDRFFMDMINHQYARIPTELLPEFYRLAPSTVTWLMFLMGEPHFSAGRMWDSAQAGLSLERLWTVSGLQNPLAPPPENFYMRNKFQQFNDELKRTGFVKHYSMDAVRVRVKRYPY